jgi:hypothetical protein
MRIIGWRNRNIVKVFQEQDVNFYILNPVQNEISAYATQANYNSSNGLADKKSADLKSQLFPRASSLTSMND